MMIHLKYWISGGVRVNWKLIKLTTQYTEVLCLLTVWVCLHEKIQIFTCKAKLSMKLFIDLSYTGTGSIISETYSVSILSRSTENCSSHNHSITTVSNLDSKLKKLLTSNKFLWIRIVFLPKTTEALRSMSKKLENKIITSINLIPLNTSFEC